MSKKRTHARARAARWLKRTVLWPLEAVATLIVYLLLSALPVAWASGLFGGLARAIGPRLGVSNRARRNIALALPEKTPAEVEAILLGMWDNLGRTAGEYAGLRRLWDDTLAKQAYNFGAETYRSLPAAARPAVVRGRRVEVVGVENFVEIRDDGKPGILFSAHLGNWELLPLGAGRFDLTISALFRAPNNPWFARVLRFMRRDMGPLLPKGLEGALASVRVLETGGHLGMLVDQKQNRGIAVPFFGHPAMTVTSLAKFAWRYRCPVHGAWVERLGGARFRITVLPALDLDFTCDEDAFILATMTAVNAVVEGWVRAHPEQWFWLHRRWPDSTRG